MIAITAPRIMAAQFFPVVAVTGSAIGILLGWHSAYSLVQGQTNIGRYLPEHLTCPVVPQQLLSAHQREYPTCQWQPPLKSGRIAADPGWRVARSEEHTSELQSLMRISYAVFCLKKKKTTM